MTAAQVAALGLAFTEYVRGFQSCFVTENTSANSANIVAALLSDLARKSDEPIAVAGRRRADATGVPHPSRLRSRCAARPDPSPHRRQALAGSRSKGLRRAGRHQADRRNVGRHEGGGDP